MTTAYLLHAVDLFRTVYIDQLSILLTVLAITDIFFLVSKCSDLEPWCVHLAKSIAGTRKQPRSGHFLVLSLCGRVIEGVRDVTNR